MRRRLQVKNIKKGKKLNRYIILLVSKKVLNFLKLPGLNPLNIFMRLHSMIVFKRKYVTGKTNLQHSFQNKILSGHFVGFLYLVISAKARLNSLLFPRLFRRAGGGRGTKGDPPKSNLSPWL